MSSDHWRNSLLSAQSDLKDANRWRTRCLIDSPQRAVVSSDDVSLVNFSSNDYLGFAANPMLIQAASQGVEQWGVGAGASHLVCGHQTPHQNLEGELAEFVGAERALLFSNGYMANLALCTALIGKGDLLLMDRLNHASIVDGAKLSDARFKRYAHCDLGHAEARIHNSSFSQLMIVTDGVFSMDGDIAPLDGLKSLADQHSGLLCVDDAHGCGVLGDLGQGSLSRFGLSPADNVVLMGTLGKAFGNYGAFIAGDDDIIQHLIQSARSYIYTTALPPSVALGSSAALALHKNQWAELQSSLKNLIDLFKFEAGQAGLTLMPSETPIQPVLIGDEGRCVDLSTQLRELGFLVAAIRTPTVAKGAARLRVVISAQHTKDQVRGLVRALSLAILDSGYKESRPISQ